MPTSLYARMLKRMKALGFNSESAYLQFLTRNDVVRQDTPMIAVEIPVVKLHQHGEVAEEPSAGGTAKKSGAKSPAKKKRGKR